MAEASVARAQNELNRRFIDAIRAGGGTLPDGASGAPILLLTTTGRRSGQPRTVPLLYTRDGERYVVLASYLGSPTHPDWYHNLLAQPTATVELPGERFAVRCSVAQGAERDRLFERQAAQMPMFTEYQQKTSRRIPVVLLERAPEPGGLT